jgi:uncharacterized protein (DUF1697 family)
MGIAMLRAVNVAGHQKISMEALKALCVSMGFRDVRTYIQSGNLVFREKREAPEKIALQLEKKIETEFGFRPAVIVRTAAEMRRVITDNPFAGRNGIEPNKLLVVFMGSEPTQKARELVLGLDCAPEEMHIVGREIYIYYPDGMARPKIPLVRLEKMLQCSSTGRNLNTVNKLMAMAEELEGLS